LTINGTGFGSVIGDLSVWLMKNGEEVYELNVTSLISDT
jgi:hypothetical protein